MLQPGSSFAFVSSAAAAGGMKKEVLAEKEETAGFAGH